MDASTLVALILLAQATPQQQQAPRTPKQAAPIDVTGDWVSVVTEDWRWRMLTPKKGDYSSVPLSPEGRKLADTWDPTKAASDGCKAYGGAGIMRLPTRLHVTWDNDTTLKIETDAGAQTRLLRFDKPQKSSAEPSWQGSSMAEWERIPSPGGAGVSLQQGAGRAGALKVVTTNLRAGYLRTNGVPYSDVTIVTEYYDRLSSDGTEWLTVLSIVEDPKYLNQPFILSSHFKREPDRSKWSPARCE